MLNEKLQIMIDKETTKDVLVLHEKTCDKYGIPFNPSWNSKDQLYSNGGNTHKWNDNKENKSSVTIQSRMKKPNSYC